MTIYQKPSEGVTKLPKTLEELITSSIKIQRKRQEQHTN